MKKIILILGLTVFVLGSLFAQHEMKLDDEWIQKIRAEKVAFLTSELQLTPGEAQNFWPVYNEFDKKRFDIHMEKRQLEHEEMEKLEGMKDNELHDISIKFVNLFQKEADLMKEYNKKFIAVLPIKKVVMFYDKENDFRSHMLRDYRKNRK